MIKSKVACFVLLVVFTAVACSYISEPCDFKIENFQSGYTWKPNPIQGDLPKNWHWGNVNGTNFLTQMRNQHIPHYCGGCWAFGTTSAISDRISIMRGGKWPEINISPQVLLSCNTKNNGCHGGAGMRAYEWMHDNDITDETCAPFLALGWSDGQICTDLSLCKECFDGKPCFKPKSFNTYRVAEYALLPENSVDAMKNEIYARGPISCAVNAGPLEDFSGTGVLMSDDKGSTNHVISIVGWGVTNDNIPYWVVRNSWGEYWADRGFAKVYMGNNTIQIESYCHYGVPVNTWQNQPTPDPFAKVDAKKENVIEIPKEHNEDSDSVDINTQSPEYKTRQFTRPNCVIDHNIKMKPLIKSPLPQDYVDVNALPDNFWWGNSDSTNFLSWQVNQHLPQFCGSCWGQAAAASLADRINIQRNNAFPRVSLSVQVLLNCFAEGTCGGGWGGGPYTWGHKHGIPEVGCQAYIAADPADPSCTDIHQCMNCKRNDQGGSTCWAQPTFKRWYVKEYGHLFGIDNMKKEIFARGPISCSMFATDNFELNYKGGIYAEKGSFLFPNHYVSVTGWGLDQVTGIKYWIARNTWGSHFGENGFFRIKMGSDNLGLDSMECFWGVPSETKSYEEDILKNLVTE